MFWQGRSEIGNKQYFFLGLTDFDEILQGQFWVNYCLFHQVWTWGAETGSGPSQPQALTSALWLCCVSRTAGGTLSGVVVDRGIWLAVVRHPPQNAKAIHQGLTTD